MSKRYRNWACILYPESVASDWQTKLDDYHVPYLLSPLHDHDVNANGEKKKAHYHLLLLYDGVKTEDQVKEVFTSLGGVGCEVVNSIRQYARYLCHLDNPDKWRYQESDVRSSGVDYMEIISLVSDKYAAIRDILQFCNDNQIYLYCDLLDYALVNEEGWFRVLCDSGTYVVKEYLKSLEYKYKNFSPESL